MDIFRLKSCRPDRSRPGRFEYAALEGYAAMHAEMSEVVVGGAETRATVDHRRQR